MLTKKQLLERLKDAPDDALIGELQTVESTVFSCFWQGETKTEICMIDDLMKDAKYVPLKNTFSLDDLK